MVRVPALLRRAPTRHGGQGTDERDRAELAAAVRTERARDRVPGGRHTCRPRGRPLERAGGDADGQRAPAPVSRDPRQAIRGRKQVADDGTQETGVLAQAVDGAQPGARGAAVRPGCTPDSLMAQHDGRDAEREDRPASEEPVPHHSVLAGSCRLVRDRAGLAGLGGERGSRDGRCGRRLCLHHLDVHRQGLRSPLAGPFPAGVRGQAVVPS